MNEQTKKTIARLCHEGLLFTNDVVPRRLRVTLPNLFAAAKEEPRVYAVIPALILHKLGIIFKFKRDCAKFAQEINQAKKILDPAAKEKYFFGIDKQECQRIAQRFGESLARRRQKQHSSTVTFRLKPEDLGCLRRIAKTLNLTGVSQVIRYLGHEFEARGGGEFVTPILDPTASMRSLLFF